MFARSAVIACCLLLTSLAVSVRGGGSAPQPRRMLADMPPLIGEWRGEPGPALDPGAVAMLGADDYLNRIYTRPGAPPVAVYIGYYGSQRSGDTIHSPLNCLPGAWWEPTTRARMAIQVAGGPLVRVNRLVVQKGLDRELVLYWYQSHGRVTASEYAGRAWLVLDALRTARTDGAIVRLIAPIGSGTRAEAFTEQAARSFVETLFPLLGRYIPN
ncbi:MAG: exosortase C-terminal domain/associated protein EpsI [Bacteroidales bacterium]